MVTTLVDYYGLPQGEGGAWPGRREAARLANVRKAEEVEAALLFSDCAAFSREICRPELEATLQGIRDAFPTPEDINGSPETAPSKRLQALIPGYQKPLLGTLGALEIGLEAMRRECPHFDAWISRLELLAA